MQSKPPEGVSASTHNRFAILAIVVVLLLPLLALFRTLQIQNLLSIWFWGSVGLFALAYGLQLIKRRHWFRGIVAVGMGLYLLAASGAILGMIVLDPNIQRVPTVNESPGAPSTSSPASRHKR